MKPKTFAIALWRGFAAFRTGGARPITCAHCQGQMLPTTRREHSSVGLLLGIIAFIFGVALCTTLFGAVFGVPIIIIALFMGAKKRKVYQCDNCNVIVDRA